MDAAIQITDLVPSERRDHQEYWRQRRELENGLASAQILDIWCTHEAGHWHYFERAGLTGFEFSGPTMEYYADLDTKDEKDRYSYYPAAVRTRQLNEIQSCDEDKLCEIANAAVAGGVFVDFFLHSTERGDTQDYNNFKNFHLKMYKNDLSLGYDPRERWNQAKTAVETELKALTEQKRSEIVWKVGEVRYRCFGVR